MVETQANRKTHFLTSIGRPDLPPAEAQDNYDLLEGELESLEATLEPTEFKITKTHPNQAIKAIVELSIVPNVACKIFAKNIIKGYTTELRRLPALNLTIAVTEAYPSIEAPHILIESDFYLKHEQSIVRELQSRWSEGCPVMFDYVNYVWDEMVDQLQLSTKSGSINLEYPSEAEF